MNKLLAMLLLAFAAVLNSCAPANHAPTSADELKEKFETALKAGDTNAILSLYNWDGVSNDMKSRPASWLQNIPHFLSEHSTNEIRIFTFLRPLPDDFEMESVRNGIRYRPNVAVVGMMEGSLSVDDNGTNTSWGAEFPYGERKGGFYFAVTTAEKIYEPKVKEKPFQITITRTNFSVQTAYAVSYVYLQNDQEIKRTFTGTNTFRRLIWANELTSCVLRKLSDDKDLIKLEISELSTNKLLTLLDSETSSKNAPIIYERK